MIINSEQNEHFCERLAIALFGFMRQASIRCTFRREPTDSNTFYFEVKDITDDGTPFGMAFKVDSSLAIGVEDTPEGIEKFCYAMALKTQNLMTEDKLGRLLQFVDKSKIYIPNAK